MSGLKTLVIIIETSVISFVLGAAFQKCREEVKEEVKEEAKEFEEL